MRNPVVRAPDEVPFEHGCFATLGSIRTVKSCKINIDAALGWTGAAVIGEES